MSANVISTEISSIRAKIFSAETTKECVDLNVEIAEAFAELQKLVFIKVLSFPDVTLEDRKLAKTMLG